MDSENLKKNLVKDEGKKFRGKQVYRKQFYGVSRKVIIKNCKHCSQQFIARVDRIKARGRKTCGKSCASSLRASKKDRTGQNNPVYKGKKSYVQTQKENGQCKKCNEKRSKTLCFHHIDPETKVKAVSRMAIEGEYTLNDVKKEIDKCILICNNCHKLEHIQNNREMCTDDGDNHKSLNKDGYKQAEEYYSDKKVYIGDSSKDNSYRHIIKNCRNCGKSYFSRIAELKEDRGYFCSTSCASKFRNSVDNFDIKESKAEFVRKIKYNMSCSKTACKESRRQCLEFHHVKPEEKVDGINKMLTNGSSLNELKKEVKKCTIICRNCHQIEHTK